MIIDNAYEDIACPRKFSTISTKRACIIVGRGRASDLYLQSRNKVLQTPGKPAPV